MATQIKFTPAGESTEVTLDLTELAGGISRLEGFRVAGDVDRVVSRGGKAKTVVHEEPFFEYECDVPLFNRDNASGGTYWFSILTQFLSHADRGGGSKFLLDSGNTLDTTISTNATQGAASVSVNDTTSLAAGDWILLEDSDDPTKYESQRVASVGASSVTVEDTLAYGFVSGSVCRHLEYFPACIVTETPELIEREGGRGIGFEFSLEFRTVR